MQRWDKFGGLELKIAPNVNNFLKSKQKKYFKAFLTTQKRISKRDKKGDMSIAKDKGRKV